MAMYTVVSYKYQLGAGGEEWDNLYEIVTDGTIDSGVQGIDYFANGAVLLNAAQAIVDYERTFHLESTYFDRVSIRTWEPDTQPYDGNELISIPIGLYGQRGLGFLGEPLGLDDTFYVRRQPQTGNLGKITYRGVLTEGDSVVSAQGLKQLNPASDLAVGGELWVEARALIAVGLSDWRDQGQDEWAFAMIHRNTSETVVARPMVNFVPGGIRPMQLKKKHYNRSSSRLTKTAKETNNVLASIQEQLNIINKKLGLVD
jgi:hypothetical protein